jgi:pyochelin biosynthetic protein PchC
MTIATTDLWRTWLRCLKPMSDPALRLVCFPHAGGAANFFRPWAGRLPYGVELHAVQYPGRQDRIRDEFAQHIDELVDPVAAALESALPRPLALFGHSMGAAVAYEVARRLESRGSGPLAGLVVSGRPAPHRQRHDDVHIGGDEALIADVRRLGGAGSFDDPDLLALALPVLRADYHLIETYTPEPGAVLETPITACIGDTDPEVDPAEAQAWSGCTTGPFGLRTFTGDHFYLVPKERQLVEEVIRRCDPRPTGPSFWPSAP